MSEDNQLLVAGTEAWLVDGDSVQVGGGEWRDPAYRDFVGLCDATGLWLVSPGDATAVS
jgi:hypothetical protein